MTDSTKAGSSILSVNKRLCTHGVVESGTFGTRCTICGLPAPNLLSDLLAENSKPEAPAPSTSANIDTAEEDVFTRATRDLSR